LEVSTPICIASSPEFPGAAFIFAAADVSSKFCSGSREGMRREKESPRKKSNAKRRECRERVAVSCCFVSYGPTL
jgi:hypothetical protein